MFRLALVTLLAAGALAGSGSTDPLASIAGSDAERSEPSMFRPAAPPVVLPGSSLASPNVDKDNGGGSDPALGLMPAHQSGGDAGGRQPGHLADPLEETAGGAGGDQQQQHQQQHDGSSHGRSSLLTTTLDLDAGDAADGQQQAALGTAEGFWGRRRRRNNNNNHAKAMEQRAKALEQQLKAVRAQLKAKKNKGKKRGGRRVVRRKKTVRRRVTRRKNRNKKGGGKRVGDAELDRRIHAAIRRIMGAKKKLAKMGVKKNLEAAEYKKYCTAKACKAAYLKFKAAEKRMLAADKRHRATQLRNRALIATNCNKKYRRKWKELRRCRRAQTTARAQIRKLAAAKKDAAKHKLVHRTAYTRIVTTEQRRRAKLAATAARHAAARRVRGGNAKGVVTCKPKDHACRKTQALRRVALAKLRKADALRKIAQAKRQQAERKRAEAKRAALRKKKLAAQRKRKAAALKRAKKRAAAARKRKREADRRKRAAARRKRKAIAKAMAARERLHQAKVAKMIRKIFHWKGRIPKSLKGMKMDDLGKIIRYMRKNGGWQTVTDGRGGKGKRLSLDQKRHILNYYKYYLSFSSGVGPWW